MSHALVSQVFIAQAVDVGIALTPVKTGSEVAVGHIYVHLPSIVVVGGAVVLLEIAEVVLESQGIAFLWNVEKPSEPVV